MLRPPYFRERTRCPLNRRQGGPQRRSGRFWRRKKTLAPYDVECHKHVLKAPNPRLTDIYDLQLIQHRTWSTIRKVFIELFVRSVSCLWPEVVAAKLSFLTVSGQRSRQGTKIQIPVNGNIKHGAHSLDARQSLTESVFARYFYETQWRAGWQKYAAYGGVEKCIQSFGRETCRAGSAWKPLEDC